MKYTRSEAKSWVKKSLRGYIGVTTTPMMKNGEIDEAGLRHNVDFLLDLPGVKGLYMNSIYQEFWTMTLDERKRVADIVIEAVDGRAPVIVGANHTSARDVVDLCRHAQAAGADLAMVWPPYYGVRTEEGVHAYYEYVAERVEIGMCIYSTVLTELGHFLTPEAVEKLSKIDNICAVKEVSLSLSGYSQIMERCGHLLSISSPLEEYHLFGMAAYPDRVPNFLLGSSRPIYMQDKDKPYCKQFWDAVERKDIAAASVAMRQILAVSNALHSRYLAKGTHNVALTKHITGLMGMAAGPVRPPMSAPPQEQIDEAVAVLTEAGLLPKKLRMAS